MGPAGVTLVVVKKDILGNVTRKIPSMLDYQVHISKESMFNTPPVFAVYTSLLTLEWLKEQGGIAAIEEVNEKKAKLLYSEIDLNPLFRGYAEKEDRSRMNATFELTEPGLRETFDSLWKAAGIRGLNGHRSLGGYRASMYNALSLESVGVLVDVMSDLERRG
jgi:phosphoserine aminotransferase